ncbi:MAG: hypothetical protein H7Z37_02580 [Pyrinomonadaceae bacterium]|nr:hypothetical protein [Pyrinomonadaceae bacterium]
MKQPDLPPQQIVAALRTNNLLPAIIFTPTRRKCDESAAEVALLAKKSQSSDERQEKRREFVTKYLAANPEIKGHKHRQIVIRGGVASHHAGHVPAWKLLVEKLMSAGLLDAIFATTTVAAGVDFPARTVVLSQADARGNDGWRPLRASELQQMTGRAGRRGRDKVGFIVLAPGVYQNPTRIANLLKAKPDALTSQFRATYSSLLNLLDAYGSFAQVREIAEKSFAFRETRLKIIELEKLQAEREEIIESKIAESPFDLTLDDVRGLERLSSARMRLLESLPESRAEIRLNWLKANVHQGRIVTHGKAGKNFFLVLQKHGEKVVALRENGEGANFNITKISRIYAKKYPLEIDSIGIGIDEIDDNVNPILDEPRKPTREDYETDAAHLLTELMNNLTPRGLTKLQRSDCMDFLWEMFDDADFINKTSRDINILRDEIWLPFERRAKVLDHFGYLDYKNEVVTTNGKWLADVRVDRPLLVGEALSNGFLTDLSLPDICALMAALAADSDRKYGELSLDDDVVQTLRDFEEIAYEVARKEYAFGVEPTPELNYSAAATAAFWANEKIEWADLVEETNAEEGDLVRLLSRTGEALMQIAALKKSQPEAARIAYEAAEIILRAPIR